ncbi:subclass B1 metallo-beta-lactamase [Shewanella sp. D64]|uniref:subclass B1 metallo-beta-lactamase n=1 Tax=unclassified Shewanella TaxID=196818 RepID=UPI0022BA1AC9|nr:MULTISPECIES: subclass B1 metallo-beta-lactamase [unclassified Shewanella]MEC4728568.1 subclass B1 metallo-beta-lactamase [Shewanella sp. D64]MEC4740572.1 subclass B1 metallo-beta-lactamase [Shewanella sp. E94]WBJ94237.1 subclass B1 metallo-beta-lactamase [Shewanella sp. MTB7]
MTKYLSLMISAYRFSAFSFATGVLMLLTGVNISSANELPESNASQWTSEVIKISEVSPTLFLVKSYKEVKFSEDKPAMTFDSNSFIYLDKHDAYFIDTPWSESDMPDLMRWLEIQQLQLKGTIVTHYHQDRAGGLGYLDKRGFATYASKMTNLLLVKDKKPTSNHSFSGDKFELLKGQIEAFYPGSGHSMDNLVVWLPEEKVIIGGCLLKDKNVNNLGWTGDADLANWYHSINKVKAEFPQVEFIFPGHGEGAHGQSILDHSLSVTKGVASFE